jgi:hypothetical protein
MLINTLTTDSLLSDELIKRYFDKVGGVNKRPFNTGSVGFSHNIND